MSATDLLAILAPAPDDFLKLAMDLKCSTDAAVAKALLTMTIVGAMANAEREDVIKGLEAILVSYRELVIREVEKRYAQASKIATA
jgi:hypothetical protein